MSDTALARPFNEQQGEQHIAADPLRGTQDNAKPASPKILGKFRLAGTCWVVR
jgi:hypothetical protein